MSVSAVVEIQCEPNNCKNILGSTKNFRNIHVTNAFRTHKYSPNDADVIITLDVDSEKDLIDFKKNLSQKYNPRNIRIRISKRNA
ncbi:hypothetical protein [Candidatus Nitrosocosmicus sp. SS]|jgi:hypothetical protein|uniref:hypothetical protein n=1 Tax=Candidatus Nitrosocosmicus agrestis TaxID=2563600 RepID=UPI00122E136B|nr:hypothetical protein [Candidatus Nitrosocosmicus sp. SS]KAA2283862.1 hypothetical protein F1Z66_00880 [Candidatus Nitrosocosmicus sp. SS]KAF0870238.1 hypothetical protein E5N71_01595 [Candidatus Nitrosocosmicus sp. SS]